MAAPCLAHPHTIPGIWTPLSPMPSAVLDIYAAPFFDRHVGAQTDKPKPFNVIVTAGGASSHARDEITNQVNAYDPVANLWLHATPLPEARRQLALVAHNGFLYAIGGYSMSEEASWRMQTNCWRLETLNDVWRPMRPLDGPRAEGVCHSFDTLIHIIGGRAPFGSANYSRRDHLDTDQHWAYDARENRWFQLAPMPTSRSSSAGAVLGKVLHVIGGRSNGSGALTAHETYDPLADRWSTAAPLPEALSGLTASTLEGKIFIFGGAQSTDHSTIVSDVWAYDDNEDKWRPAAPMRQPRRYHAAVALEKAIYLLGGEGRSIEGAASNVLDRFEA